MMLMLGLIVIVLILLDFVVSGAAVGVPVEANGDCDVVADVDVNGLTIGDVGIYFLVDFYDDADGVADGITN